MAVERLISMDSRGPEITEDDVLRFEQKLGCRLPEDYREFLLFFNGGQPSLDQVVFPIGKDSTILNSFHGLHDSINNLEERRDSLMDQLPPELLSIGYDGTGSILCLAIFGNKRGEVWFNDRLEPHEPKLFLEWYERKRDFKKVADSFTDFIKMLQPYPEV